MDRELIKKLIEEGLELYGYGKVEEAVEKWREVLKLEPDNEIVLDYLATAGVNVDEERRRIEEETLKRDILKMVEEGRVKEVIELLESKEKKTLEDLCFDELLRYAMFYNLRERYKDGRTVPYLKISSSELVHKSLTPKEGFMISQIDGNINVKNLADLCNLSEEEIYLSLAKLEEEGIIGLR